MDDILIKQLNDMSEKYKYLPPQGSIEWLNAREFSIGGSEMATLLGSGYSNEKTLIAYKVGLKTFNSVPATIWGKLFEDVANDITKIVFNIPDKNMAEFGSLPGIEGQTYSPDGVGIVKLLCDGDVYEYFTVLFEYKCPISSITSGEIPKHYIPQVKTGLCTIKISDFALFISNVFRKCAMEELAYDNEYDKCYHSSDIKKNIYFDKPLAMGVMFFYQSEAQNADMKKKMTDPWYDNIGNIVIDFGKGIHFNKLLYLYEDKLVSVEYHECIITPEMENVPFLYAQDYKTKNLNSLSDAIDNLKKTVKKDVIGVLPWKLFKSDIVYQEREEDFVKNLKPKIDAFINTVREIKGCTLDETIENYKNKYPGNKITEHLESQSVDNIKDMVSL